MSVSLRKSIITLIYKRKWKREEIRNRQPISLLNVDSKIPSKVIANQVRSALGSVIHSDQICVVPGRKITESLMLLRDTISYMQDSGVDTCLISLDQKKAFNRILRTYMWDVISKIGSGEGICNWIRLLDTNIVSAVSINGWESEIFPIRSGVRQGCLVSPALFMCCIQPFAELIRKDGSLRGMAIPGSGCLQVKASLYLDDVTVFCLDPLSADRLMSICDQFELASGAKVNQGKSEAMFFGNWANQSFIPFIVRSDYLKVLGIWFEGAGVCAKTWEEHVTKAKQKLDRWEHWSLSILGKNLVIRCEVLSVLLYVAQVWPTPQTCAAAVTQAIYHFMWRRFDTMLRNIISVASDEVMLFHSAWNLYDLVCTFGSLDTGEGGGKWSGVAPLPVAGESAVGDVGGEGRVDQCVPAGMVSAERRQGRGGEYVSGGGISLEVAEMASDDLLDVGCWWDC
eukprot:g45185.t1